MTIRSKASIFAAAILAHCGPVGAFDLSSPSIPPGGTFAAAQVYGGCGGGNISPALAWRDAPPGTRSFALSLHDPDARGGSGWWHWVLLDLPASTDGLAAGAGAGGALLPAGAVQIRNDFGAAAYGGPCPPAGDGQHHYVFTLYALKTAHLALPADAGAAMAGQAIRANAIAAARLTVLYGRPAR